MLHTLLRGSRGEDPRVGGGMGGGGSRKHGRKFNPQEGMLQGILSIILSISGSACRRLVGHRRWLLRVPAGCDCR